MLFSMLLCMAIWLNPVGATNDLFVFVSSRDGTIQLPSIRRRWGKSENVGSVVLLCGEEGFINELLDEVVHISSSPTSLKIHIALRGDCNSQVPEMPLAPSTVCTVDNCHEMPLNRAPLDGNMSDDTTNGAPNNLATQPYGPPKARNIAVTPVPFALSPRVSNARLNNDMHAASSKGMAAAKVGSMYWHGNETLRLHHLHAATTSSWPRDDIHVASDGKRRKGFTPAEFQLWPFRKACLGKVTLDAISEWDRAVEQLCQSGTLHIVPGIYWVDFAIAMEDRTLTVECEQGVFIHLPYAMALQNVALRVARCVLIGQRRVIEGRNSCVQAFGATFVGGGVVLTYHKGTTDRMICQSAPFVANLFLGTRFHRIQHSHSGGAISVHYGLGPRMVNVNVFRNVLFTETHAGRGGGAISVVYRSDTTDAKNVFENVSFVNTSSGLAGGAVSIWYGHDASDCKSIFRSVTFRNTTSGWSGGAVSIRYGGHAYRDDNVFQDSHFIQTTAGR